MDYGVDWTPTHPGSCFYVMLTFSIFWSNKMQLPGERRSIVESHPQIIKYWHQQLGSDSKPKHHRLLPRSTSASHCGCDRLWRQCPATSAVTQRRRAELSTRFMIQNQLSTPPRGEDMLSLFLTEADGSRVELRRADGARQVAAWRTEQNSAAHMRSRRC